MSSSSSFSSLSLSLNGSDRRTAWIAPILHEMITSSLSLSLPSSSSTSTSTASTSTSLGLHSDSSADVHTSSHHHRHHHHLQQNSSTSNSNMILFDNNNNKATTAAAATRLGLTTTTTTRNMSSLSASSSSFADSIISQVLLSPLVASSSPSPALAFYDFADASRIGTGGIVGESMPAPMENLFQEDMAPSAGGQLGGPGLNETAGAGFTWPIRDPLYIVIPITIIYVLILITGLLGNVVTCVVIVRSRYLHTATNYYLFSLAISDLLLLLSGLPAEMHTIWRRYPDVFGEVFCVAKGLASETSANATVLTIAAFTVERYLAICKPFLIQKWQNKLSRVVRQILVIWVISILLAVPQALQLGLVSTNVSPTEKAMICNVKHVIIEHSFEIATFLFFVGPMILITVLYCLIGYTLYNSSRVNESKLRLRKSLSSHKREAGQQRVLKMLVAVVIAFFICWAPFHAQRLIATWGSTWLESSPSLKTAYHTLIYISGVLYYVSTCINPFLYQIMSLKFRRAFQVMVEGVCSDSFGLGGDSSRRPQDAHFLRDVFPDRASQSTSRSSRSTTNGGHHPLTEITMISRSRSAHGYHGHAHLHGHGQMRAFKAQASANGINLSNSASVGASNGATTWQPSVHIPQAHNQSQYPYYPPNNPQRHNFGPPSIATIV